VATARIRRTFLEIRRWVVGRWVTPTEADRAGALPHINGCAADGGTLPHRLYGELRHR